MTETFDVEVTREFAGDHEVVLTDLGGGRTRLEMIERGYLTTEARDLSAGGLEQCLEKMAAVVE